MNDIKITLHTTAGDVFGNGGTVLTYRSENGFQTRVALELHAERMSIVLPKAALRFRIYVCDMR